MTAGTADTVTANTGRSARANRSFAIAPLFHLVFAHAARTADHQVLTDLLDDALRREPAFPSYILEAAARRFATLGDIRRSVRALRSAAVLEPRQGASIVSLMALAKQAGRESASVWSRAGQVLSSGAPIHSSAALMDVATKAFEIPSYLTVLETIARVADPDTYLEIGIGQGDSQICFRGARRRIGVDPAPRVSEDILAQFEFHRTTSDAYFATLDSGPGRPRADIIFIDGLHESDQVLRDFANAETVAAPGALILFHDVMPVDPVSASKVRKSRFWLGDCWRALHYLVHHRSDLDVAVVPAAPSGLALVRHTETHRAASAGSGPDDFDSYADALDLNRDLGPLLLRLRWLSDDAGTLKDFAEGAPGPETGYARYDFTAEDALILSACSRTDRPLDWQARLRLRLIWDPGSAIEISSKQVFGLGALDPEAGRRLYGILMWARCIRPGDAALPSIAGTILNLFHEAGKMDVLANLRWGRLLSNRLDRNILFDAKIRALLADAAPKDAATLAGAVAGTLSRLDDRIDRLARESGTTPEIARRMAEVAAAVSLAGAMPSPRAVEPVGSLEVWKAHPRSSVPAETGQFNRIGYLQGRPVPDARVTPRPQLHRTTYTSSHNTVRVERLANGIITDDMLSGSPGDGLLLGDFLAFNRSRRLLADSSLRREAAGLYALTDRYAVIRAARRTVQIEGPAIPGLNAESSKVFGHFILEALGRTLAARAASGHSDPTLVLPDDAPGFVKEIYRLFGFGSFQRLAKGERAVASEVFVADTSEEVLANFALYDVVREAASGFGGSGGPEKIYLSRRGLAGGDRYQTNEEEVETRLAEIGFSVIRPETLPFAEQIALYRGAETVVSPYGSAIHVAALFARPGTRFVEALTRRTPQQFVAYYQNFGHRYSAVPTTFVDADGQGFEIDIDALMQAVR